jgi:hypothetical protein
MDGGFVLAGHTHSYGTGNSDCWLVKTDSNGHHEWNISFGGSATDIALSVIQTTDMGYAITGWTDSYGSGSYDIWLVKITQTEDLTTTITLTRRTSFPDVLIVLSMGIFIVTRRKR